MKTNTLSRIILFDVLGIFFFSLNWASGGETFVLQPTDQHPKANGTAVIDNDHISVQARGLKPDAVYTIWFVNMKPMKSETGAGAPPYMFRTDQKAAGRPLRHIGAAIRPKPMRPGSFSIIFIDASQACQNGPPMPSAIERWMG